MSEDVQQGDELEKKLRQEAEAFSMRPSKATWDHIEQRLHPVKSTKPAARWWWAAALLLLIAGWGGYELMTKSPSSSSAGGGDARSGKTVTIAGSNKSPDHAGAAAPAPADTQSRISPGDQPIIAASHINSIRRRNTASAGNREDAGTGSGLAVAGSNNVPVDNQMSLQPGTALHTIEPPVSYDAGINFPVTQTTMLPAGLTDAFQPAGNPVLHQRPHFKPSFEIVVVPAVSFRNMYQDYADNGPDRAFYPSNSRDYIHSNQLHHTPEAAFTIGARIKFPLNNRLALVSGLQVSKTGYNIEATKTAGGYTATSSLSGSSRNPAGGANSSPVSQSLSNATYGVYANPPGGYQRTIRTTYVMLGAPVALDYRIPLQHQWAVHIAAGASVDYLVSKRAYIYAATYKRYFNDNSLIKNWNTNFLFSSYIAIPAGKVFLQAGPDFKYQLLNSYRHNYPVKEYPYSAGLRLGISWKP